MEKKFEQLKRMVPSLLEADRAEACTSGRVQDWYTRIENEVSQQGENLPSKTFQNMTHFLRYHPGFTFNMDETSVEADDRRITVLVPRDQEGNQKGHWQTQLSHDTGHVHICRWSHPSQTSRHLPPNNYQHPF